MRMIDKIRDKLFLVNAKDVLSLILLPLAVIKAATMKKRKIWLILERATEARDNGVVFFEYIKESHPEIECYYAIDKRSRDYERVKKYRESVVQFGSFQHMVLFLACEANVSSVKNMGPNDFMGYIFRKLNLLVDKNFFLQHGTIINDCEWLHYPDTKFRLFCCGSVPEYEYVKETYGYPEGNVINNGGQCRFDLLCEDNCVKNKKILVLPSWRKWLKVNDPQMLEIEGTKDFLETEYYKRWNEFLGSKRLSEILEAKDVDLVFYPHPTMQIFADRFRSSSDKISIGNLSTCNLQEEIRESSMIITDYSSVVFDFVFMGKPIVFYQFDAEKFEKYHYKPGYFSYSNNPVSDGYKKLDDVLECISTTVDDDFNISDEYKNYRNYCFPVRDNKNSERVFNNIQKIIHG